MAVENQSLVALFALTQYVDVGVFRPLVLAVVLACYLLIVGSNLVVVMAICSEPRLHEPMYVLLCSLLLNELSGSAALFPFFMVQILRETHTVSAALCLFQIFCLYFYVNVQFYSLTAMSYDRYLAICRPLRYGAFMTPRVMALTVALCWLLPILAIVTMTTLTATLSFCGEAIDRLYCDNYSVVKLACGNTLVNNVYGLAYTFVVLLGLTLVIVACYARILHVCFNKRSQRRKAVTTCAPHLASLFNFSLGCFLEIIQSRLDLSAAPQWLRTALSLYFITFQPLFNPLLYGLSLGRVRTAVRALLKGWSWKRRGQRGQNLRGWSVMECKAPPR